MYKFLKIFVVLFIVQNSMTMEKRIQVLEAQRSASAPGPQLNVEDRLQPQRNITTPLTAKEKEQLIFRTAAKYVALACQDKGFNADEPLKFGDWDFKNHSQEPDKLISQLKDIIKSEYHNQLKFLKNNLSKIFNLIFKYDENGNLISVITNEELNLLQKHTLLFKNKKFNKTYFNIAKQLKDDDSHFCSCVIL